MTAGRKRPEPRDGRMDGGSPHGFARSAAGEHTANRRSRLASIQSCLALSRTALSGPAPTSPMLIVVIVASRQLSETAGPTKIDAVRG